MKVFVPVGPSPGGEAASLRRRLDPIEGTVIGIIDNSMPNGNDFMDDVEALLVKSHGVREVVRFRKQPGRETPDEAMAAFVKQCGGLIVGMGNSGAPTSWCVRDSVRAARAGLPVVLVGTDEFREFAREESIAMGHADLPLVSVRHPFTQETRDDVRAAATKATLELVDALHGATSQSAPAAPSGTSFEPVEAGALIEVSDEPGEFNRYFFERGWSDGLPIIPPSRELVDDMLRHTRRGRDEVVGRVAPYGLATVESVAVNAVMAGCRPEYLPVLLAATEAIGQPEFDLLFLQHTIHPTTTMLVLSGPVVERLGVNGGANCFGPGAWANATMGRALRLVTLTIGGGRPGAVDKSTQGQVGKFLMCIAENMAQSPWEPLHVEHGFAPDVSTVTVVAAKNPLSFTTHTQDVDDFLTIIANAMTGVTASEHRSGGGPMLVLSPEHAQMLAGNGVSKQEFKRRVWETARLPLGRMSVKERARTQEERRGDMGEFGPDTTLPPSKVPDDIIVLVAGGWGMLSSFIPCHAPLSWPVTRVVDDWTPPS
ncbi:hypothetical protein NOCA250054 [metagenome]|uniref:UGSC-like domain-containing protein n=1 Tax=metagenome TaxID=256318 RepID=A0A2P2C8V7_9ZZZZ